MPYKDPEQQRKYLREWIAARRETWIEENGPCVDCSKWEDLEVDHIDASQKVSHRVWSWTEKRRLAELVKCVVRCHSCHAKKTTAMGEHARGEKSGKAILREKDIPVIRASTESRRILAERYRVSTETIKTVRAHRSWKHIE